MKILFTALACTIVFIGLSKSDTTRAEDSSNAKPKYTKEVGEQIVFGHLKSSHVVQQQPATSGNVGKTKPRYTREEGMKIMFGNLKSSHVVDQKPADK